jgi:glucosamine--fructose-6-phosphate aminotransferase (isomerizing)
MGGALFESEIREQPAVWRRIAASDAVQRLYAAIGDRDVVFTGSGSSLFVAQLAALAWRRDGRRTSALAASEARFHGAVRRGVCVVALSQSGRTGDVLDALDALAPSNAVVLTSDIASPLAARGGVTIDLLAGAERAIPASKSVTAMAAMLLASPLDARVLIDTAERVGVWLAGDASTEMDAAAALIEPVQSIVVIGAGFGVPVADEIALKIKESTYRHAEGFGAAEFRHGSTAILDATRGLIGIADPWSRDIVGDVLRTGRAAGSAVATIGDAIEGVPTLGPGITGTFAPLGWIVTGQFLALSLARRAGIDSDTPRGLQKFLA